MEPISAAASAITILGAMGGACKAVYETILDFNDAPREIRMQNKKVESLHSTITSLVRLCEKNPADYPLDLQLCGIQEFISDVKALELKLKSKDTQLQSGKIRRVRESCKWLLFDRHLRKFFDSLEHWNIILSQALWQAQITLCNRFLEQTSPGTQDGCAKSTSLVSKSCIAASSTASAQAIVATDICADHATVRKHVVDNSHTARLSADIRLVNYLRKISYPIGTLSKHYLQIDNRVLSLTVQGGRVMLKSWTRTGRETLTILQQSKGYACIATLQALRIIRWSLVISLFMYQSQCPASGLNLRFNFRVRRILPFEHPCFTAIAKGDVTYIQHQLSSGELYLTDCAPEGYGLLHFAARFNQLSIISILLDQGADVNMVNDIGETPLRTAIEQNSSYDCVRLLMNYGADLGHCDNRGRTPLHCSYNQTMHQVLLLNKQDIDHWIQDSSGMTIMHWVSWSRQSTLETLPSLTPIQAANIASPLGLKDQHGKSMLHYAVQRGNLDLTTFFLDSPCAESMSLPDQRGRSLLHYATESSKTDVLINFLLEKGFDLNAEDEKGNTVMHHAAARNKTAAVECLLGLCAGQQVGRTNRDGCTPVQIARARGSKAVVAILETHDAEDRDSIDGVGVPIRKIPEYQFVGLLRRRLCMVFLVAVLWLVGAQTMRLKRMNIL